MGFSKKIVSILSVAIFLGMFSTSGAAREYLYIFSPDAKFLKLDTSDFRIVDVGNLWWLKLMVIDGVIPDPTKQHILLKTADLWKLLDASQPIDGLVVLDEYREYKYAGTLKLVHTLQPPGKDANLSGGTITNNGNRRVLLSWIDIESGKELTQLLDGKTYEERQKIEDFWVAPGTCLSSDGLRLYAVRNGSPREIIRLDLQSLTVQRTLYDKIGSATFHSKTPVAFRNCTMLLLEYKEKPTEERAAGTLYLYDIEKDNVLSTLQIDIDGDFFLLKAGSVIAVDEKKPVPNVFPDGSVVGIRLKHVGRLHFYDAKAGKELALLHLPEDGTFVTISSDEKTGYYLSPKLLTVVDLENYKVKATRHIPFSYGVAAFYESEF